MQRPPSFLNLGAATCSKGLTFLWQCGLGLAGLGQGQGGSLPAPSLLG